MDDRVASRDNFRRLVDAHVVVFQKHEAPLSSIYNSLNFHLHYGVIILGFGVSGVKS